MEVHYFGQVAAINDCLYRNMFRSTFVLFSDIDEVAVPREAAGGDSWNSVLEHSTSVWSDEVLPDEELFPGVYMMRSVFFPTNSQHPSPGKSGPLSVKQWLKKDMYTSVSYDVREDFLHPYNVRSKYFVWTKAVVMVGIHFPYQVLYNMVKTVHVNENICLLHHLRPSSGTPLVEDHWMSRYGRNVTKRIRDRRNALLNFLTRSTTNQSDEQQRDVSGRLQYKKGKRKVNSVGKRTREQKDHFH